MKKYLCFLFIPFIIYANPHGEKVIAGDLLVTRDGATTAIAQTSEKAVMEWQSFSIAKGETTSFFQPSENSSILNRVTGGDISEIYGHLNANGKLYLVNPSGILVGPEGSINASLFVASALKLSNDDFLNGNYRFTSSDGKVANKGEITALKGIYLFAKEVENEGRLTSSSVGIGANLALYFQEEGSQHIYLEENGEGHLEEKGVIDALEIELKASGGSLYSLAINHEGILNADAIGEKDGNIILLSSGDIELSGVISAKGSKVKVDGRNITVSSLIDISHPTKPGSATLGGKDTLNLLFDSSASILASALENGSGGKVILISQDTQFFGTILSEGGPNGGNGGFVEISTLNPSSSLALKGKVSTLAPCGKVGELYIDPYDITISSDTTENGSWSDGVFSGLASGVILNADDLTAQLASNNVTVTTAGEGEDGGTITIAAPISWSSATKLSLTADKSIIISQPISNTCSIDANFDAMDFKANVAGTATGSFSGITLVSTLSSIYGNISLTGQGGDETRNQNGICITSGMVESLGTSASSAKIILNGTGGRGNWYNIGIFLAFNSQISSERGDVSLTGCSYGDGSYNGGVVLSSSSISVEDAGTLTIAGTGGQGDYNCGISIGNSSSLDSRDGNIVLTGSSLGSRTYNLGIQLLFNSSVKAKGLAQILLTGTSGNGVDHNNGITVGFASSITSKDGAISLIGNGQGSMGYNHGIMLNESSVISSSSSGDISLNGSGATTGDYNYGCCLITNSSIVSNGGALSLTGNSSGNSYSRGLFFDFSFVSLSTGDVTLFGATNAVEKSNIGILLNSTSFIISNNGENGGKIDITGLAEHGVDFCSGVAFWDNSYLTSATGDITLTAHGSLGKASNIGLILNSGSYIHATAANIHITGTGGNGSDFAQGVYMEDSSAVSAETGSVTMSGNGNSP